LAERGLVTGSDDEWIHRGVAYLTRLPACRDDSDRDRLAWEMPDVAAAAADPSKHPTPSPVNPDGIPAALKADPRWLCWRWKWRADRQGKGKWSKVPTNPLTGTNASTTNPATWATFDEALTAYQARGWAGVGFVLGDGYWGFDADGSRDPDTGELTANGREFLAHVPGYAEVSPSGTGFKVIGTGELPDEVAGRKNVALDVELYAAGRYFALTGHAIPGRGELAPVIPTRTPERPLAATAKHEGTAAVSNPRKKPACGPPPSPAKTSASPSESVPPAATNTPPPKPGGGEEAEHLHRCCIPSEPDGAGVGSAVRSCGSYHVGQNVAGDIRHRDAESGDCTDRLYLPACRARGLIDCEELPASAAVGRSRPASPTADRR
jgi:hypothetical protein